MRQNYSLNLDNISKSFVLLRDIFVHYYLLFFGLLLLFFSLNLNANTFEILEFEILLEGQNSESPKLRKPVGPYGVIVEGVYQGDATQSTLVTFELSGIPVYNYTAQTGVDEGTHSAPSINLDEMTADLSSFYIRWNDSDFHQGSENVIVSKLTDGTYSLDWTNYVPFGLQLLHWRFIVKCIDCAPIQSNDEVTVVDSDPIEEQSDSLNERLSAGNGAPTFELALLLFIPAFRRLLA